MLKSTEFSSVSIVSPDKVSIFAWPWLAIIKLYRLILSPIIGQQCRFYPTCSHYAEDALHKYGASRGGWMALKRIGRCHPWHEGGYDPVE